MNSDTNIAWCDEDLRERFEEKYMIDEETGCWEWTVWTKNDGYGRITRSRADYPYAHRVSYQLYVGEIPEGLQINHHCDNRSCVNPDHLYAGTPQENIDDAKRRTNFLENRQGESSETAKLTADDVVEIRKKYSEESGHTHRSLAEEYGVSHTAIGRAIRGEKWSHLEEGLDNE